MVQMKQRLMTGQGNLLPCVHLGYYFAQGGCGLPIPGGVEDQALSNLI